MEYRARWSVGGEDGHEVIGNGSGNRGGGRLNRMWWGGM